MKYGLYETIRVELKLVVPQDCSIREGEEEKQRQEVKDTLSIKAFGVLTARANGSRVGTVLQSPTRCDHVNTCSTRVPTSTQTRTLQWRGLLGHGMKVWKFLLTFVVQLIRVPFEI